MMEQIVECVPNFSEGRREDVIDDIVTAMKSAADVQVLHIKPDVDHNRTVVTLVGPPDAIEEAAYAGIARASDLIDMDVHEGEHPRMGATDVVPFVPVTGVSLEDCVEMANRLGRRVGEELDIPVYLYEAAATRPERVNLADVRRGQYEGIKRAIGKDPDRAPDFGPGTLGKAGATAIGARQFLIAFNVYLNTDDVTAAERIARAVRHSSGGLRYVKALGLLVEGQAQVSMNLTDFSRTPIHRALEMIRAEAARYGTSVSHSELIGLIPRQALLDSACWYLQLDVEPEQILENRLKVERPATLEQFLDDVAAETPTPGGGSVAALAGALASALTTMVGRLTLGRERYADVEDATEELVERATALRQSLEDGVKKDAEAYDQVVAVYRLPRGTEEEQRQRQAAIEEALIQAAEVPLNTARDAVAVLDLAAQAAAMGNPNALTDAATAAHMAKAAFEGAVLNVRVNAESLTDAEQAGAWLEELEQLRKRSRTALESILDLVEQSYE